VWEPDSQQNRVFDRQNFAIHRALSLRLAILKGKTLHIVTPEIVAKTATGELAVTKRPKCCGMPSTVPTQQHLRCGPEALTSRIAGVNIPTLGARLSYRKDTAVCRTVPAQSAALELKFQVLNLRRLVVEDAKLVFSSKSGHGEAKDANPLHGLVNNRPWIIQ